jgi:hypothetical protein
LEIAKIPHTDERLRKYGIHTIEKTKIMLFASRWMELENMLSKVIQAQKLKDQRFSLVCGG